MGLTTVLVSLRQLPSRWTEAGQALLRETGRREGDCLIVPLDVFEKAERKPPRPPEPLPEGYDPALHWDAGGCNC